LASSLALAFRPLASSPASSVAAAVGTQYTGPCLSSSSPDDAVEVGGKPSSTSAMPPVLSKRRVQPGRTAVEDKEGKRPRRSSEVRLHIDP